MTNNFPTDLANTSITALKGVGPKLAEKLAKCGLETIQDLLFHLPYKYQDRTRVSPIGSLRVNDYAVIEGIIESASITYGKRRSLLLTLADASGTLQIRFFHFNLSQQENLQPGIKIRCFGEVRFSYRSIEMIHPEYRCISTEVLTPVEETLTPIYPTTEGLHQKTLKNLTDQALTLLQKEGGLTELLPENLRLQHHFSSLIEALIYIHRPPPDASIQQLTEGKHPLQQRLAFEELLAQGLSLRKLRAQAQRHQAPQIIKDNPLIKAFLKHLPFTLTKAQQRVSQEINRDLQQNCPMLRLVQGDVGSGKTLVAALAMLEMVNVNYQAVLMAPTDILAEQHYHNFSQWLAPLTLEVAWLAGKHKGKIRQHTLLKIANGTAKIIIGTHALFQEDVKFCNLGLIIVDEQHRFGVQQRLALREKGVDKHMRPHQLTMTATPIPRTLAMTAYADLDVSIIDELPPGRSPVKTVVVPETKRAEVIARIEVVCGQGRQVYWVCPLIEESESLQYQAAEKTHMLLRQQLPNCTIGLIHGRMKSKEKDAVMQQFKQHALNLLVATTVIEVGVDVPNASLMIIENAERLGLSQLHQLRGRVGRGSTESFCVLLFQPPLSHHAKARLEVMRNSNDGFVIAQKDLELRGPGEVLGTRQTGLLQFKIADLNRDKALLGQVQKFAEIMLRDHSRQADAIIQRWLGKAQKYGVV